MFNPFYNTNIYLLIKQFLSIKEICKISRCSKSINNKEYYKYTMKLFDYQKPFFFKLIDHLTYNPLYIDTSIMGSGKTSVTTVVSKYLYNKYNFKYMVVIYPKNGSLVWEEFYNKIFKGDNKIKYCGMTYDMFRKDNKLVKYDEKQEKFEPTLKWKRYCKEGVFLIFDEAYKLKNKTAQNEVANTLLQELYKTKSKVTFLSGATMIDKPEQIPRYCKLFNIIKKNKLARYDINEGYILTGLDELLQYCVKNCNMTRDQYRYYFDELSSMTRVKNKKNFNDLVSLIYKEYILKKLQFTMPEQKKSVNLYQKNIYYIVSEKEEELLSDKLNKVSKRVKYNGDDVDLKRINWGELTNDLKELEVAKIKTFMVRVIKSKLKLKKKVIIMLTYKEGIKFLVDNLEEFHPLVINGDVNSMEERKKRIKKFNTNDKYNLLICNIRVASNSISLDDQVGDKERIMFILPTYCLMDCMQAEYRVYRLKTKSDATVIYPYFYSNSEKKTFRREENILTGIAKKAKFMKSMTSNELINIKFPNQFDVEIQTV